jgi:hypothetical protein
MNGAKEKLLPRVKYTPGSSFFTGSDQALLVRGVHII